MDIEKECWQRVAYGLQIRRLDFTEAVDILVQLYKHKPSDPLGEAIIELSLTESESELQEKIDNFAGDDLSLGRAYYFKELLKPLWIDSRPFSEKQLEIFRLWIDLNLPDEWEGFASRYYDSTHEIEFNEYCRNLFAVKNN